jgi:hypothetical protein
MLRSRRRTRGSGRWSVVWCGMGDEPKSQNPDGELFQPSVGADQRYLERPWNPASNFYVAFFGGVIAATAIAYLNAARLHVEHFRARILAIGLTGVVVALVAARLVADSVADDESGTYVRLASRVVAVLVHFVFAAQLKQADRRFQITGGDYESLWTPGFLAVLAGGLAQAILLYAVVRAA